ncbi:YeiH family protein [Roseiconus lacunae]|uniref:YeiH family protein n=1 Tax=Roseiconus lacunae TaxID=2605694 RepID=UPI001E5E9F75|nr:putative sulfate exporter family transporter [Roseiconus lacunae]MCD0460476.1 YeiH family protein [Roseiconus lacunae]
MSSKHESSDQTNSDLNPYTAGTVPDPTDPSDRVTLPDERKSLWQDMTTSEDWWAIWCAAILLAIAFAAVWFAKPDGLAESIVAQDPIEVVSPLKDWIAKPGKWDSNPLQSIGSSWQGILGVFVIIGVLFAAANQIRSRSGQAFLMGFPIVFALATFAYVLAGQSVIKAYNLEYALWALLVGLIVSNTLGTPDWLRKAALTEFFIKTGLVLLGAEVLMSRLLALGLPGVFVAWVVTPVVLVSTFIFGQKVLKIRSKSLNMVISADMSVCGVSAAIATAAACKAKKEELSLSIGLSLGFTVTMMAVMPVVIKALGLDPILGGAWLGGTIDSTGAVAAAGAVLGDEALEVAATVKMIQNILIGVTAFCVAIYWVTYVERDESGPKIGLSEIWYRFPKFVLGFVSMSILFSILYSTLLGGPELIGAMISGSTKTLRGWFFCMAFVSIGLETNFRQLLPQLKGGKPLVLYACGQSLNLILTLAMAWLMFKVVFADSVAP